MAPSAPTLLPSLLFLLLPRAQSAFVLHPPLPAARTRARAVSASMALEAAPFVALADAVQDVAADPSWFDSCALACPAARAAPACALSFPAQIPARITTLPTRAPTPQPHCATNGIFHQDDPWGASGIWCRRGVRHRDHLLHLIWDTIVAELVPRKQQVLDGREHRDSGMCGAVARVDYVRAAAFSRREGRGSALQRRRRAGAAAR